MNESLENLNPKNQEELDGTSALIDEEFVKIKFQLGSLKEHGKNGTTIEHVVDVLVDRLRGFQKGPFACAANAKAIGHLEMAKADLMARTADRKARGVEGRNKP